MCFSHNCPAEDYDGNCTITHGPFLCEEEEDEEDVWFVDPLERREVCAEGYIPMADDASNENILAEQEY